MLGTGSCAHRFVPKESSPCPVGSALLATVVVEESAEDVARNVRRCRKIAALNLKNIDICSMISLLLQ